MLSRASQSRGSPPSLIHEFVYGFDPLEEDEEVGERCIVDQHSSIEI